MEDPAAWPLGDIAAALADRTFEAAWYLDPTAREVIRLPEPGLDDEEGEPRDGWLRIAPPHENGEYGDMVAFADWLEDDPLADRIRAAIDGKGAFRAFRSLLHDDVPEHLTAWRRFEEARTVARAIAWLEDEGVVARGAIPEPALPARPDVPGALARLRDALAAARQAAASLARQDPDGWDDVARLVDEAAEAAGRRR